MPQAAAGNTISSTSQIVDGVITGADMANQAVDTAQLKDGAVTEAKQTLADNATGDVSTTRHGYAPKAPNDATKFLNGAAAYAQPKDSDLATTDVTTNNASSTKHGFLPKLSNNSAQFLNGIGNWASPGGVNKFGTTSYDVSSASGVVNIAHGLGAIPRFVRLIAYHSPGTAAGTVSYGMYDGTTTACVYQVNAPTNSTTNVDGTNGIHISNQDNSNGLQVAVITFDSTNIILTWTKTNSPVGTAYIFWEAVA